jgi:hypothetical protein
MGVNGAYPADLMGETSPFFENDFQRTPLSAHTAPLCAQVWAMVRWSNAIAHALFFAVRDDFATP